MAFIHIAGNTYELIMENRNGWNVEAFRNRYSDVLERYDYIVGDWGYNQLRLKGFFRDGHQKATKDSTFSYVTDYLNEYCNFGCAYFLLEKKHGHQAELSSEDDIYIEEVEYTRPIPQYKDEQDSNDLKETKDTKVAKSGKDSGKDSKEAKDAKTKAVSAVPTADEAIDTSDAPNGKDGSRNKKSAQRDRLTDNGHEHDHGKPRLRNQRSRNNQRQQAKKQADQLVDTIELEQDRKKEGKAKRKEHFYRKGNRFHDKKGKSNKNNPEHIGSGNK